MQKTKIFIDFDGTLFSTQEYKKSLFELYEKAGYSEEEVEKAYWAECQDYKYSLRGNLEKLELLRPYDHETIDPLVEESFARVPEYLYDDSINFVKSLDREKYEVNLLSLGDIEFQSEKINHSGITDLFDNVYITEQQKWDFLQDKIGQDEKFVIIDDRDDTMREIGEHFPAAVPIRIMRNDFDKNDPFLGKEYEGIQVGDLMGAVQYL